MESIIEKALKDKTLRYKISHSDKVINWRVRTKLKLIEYKGGKCIKCGYDKKQYPSAFHFHHRNPKEKEIRIGGSTLSFEKLRTETDKCDLLCSNCHAETHDEFHLKTREESIRKYSEKKEELKKIFESKLNKKCIYCSMVYDAKMRNQKFCSIRCSKSFSKQNRKVTKPSVDELKTMLQEKSFCAIGREFGVSDNAIRKWAKSYDLI